MLLVVEYGLIEMADAPAERNVVDEQVAEHSGSLGRVGVSPCTERHKDVALLVERHVAVHHGADAYGSKTFNLYIVGSLDVGPQIGIAVLQTVPDGLDAVGPQTVDKLVFPFVTPLGYGVVILIDEHGLDAGRPEFDAENGFALLNGGFGVHNRNVKLKKRPCQEPEGAFSNVG